MAIHQDTRRICTNGGREKEGQKESKDEDEKAQNTWPPIIPSAWNPSPPPLQDADIVPYLPIPIR